MAKKASQKPEPGLRFVFLCYGLLMLYLLFIRGRHAVEGVPYLEQVKENYNLIPLHTIGNYWHVLTNKAHYLTKWSYEQYLQQETFRPPHENTSVKYTPARQSRTARYMRIADEMELQKR